MTSYNALYIWSAEEGLSQAEGYAALEEQLEAQVDGDGQRYLQLGATRVDLAEDEIAYFDDSLYVADDRLWRRLQIENKGRGPVDQMLVEITMDGETFSFGTILDLGDAMISYHGDSTSASSFHSTCFMDGILYGQYYGTDGYMLAAVDMATGDVENIYLDTDVEFSGIVPYSDSELLLFGRVYDEHGMSTAVFLYNVDSDSLTTLGTLDSENGQNFGICYDPQRQQLYYVQDGSLWRVSVSDAGVGEAEPFADVPISVYNEAQSVLLGDLYVISGADAVIGRDVTAQQMTRSIWSSRKLPSPALSVQPISTSTRHTRNTPSPSWMTVRIRTA